ncbi:PadR family transcriptional regulator [Rahnella aceris]|uniref:PadR family transcriptional regulator n=1 Tax=Rahnella sp. (strain Y9602) TaxID=2703885 RepID=UPI001F3C65CF|nr:PadR family transcriptional regulator [Rahnella aceris]
MMNHKHRRERMFETGDIRLLMLHFLQRRPAHGYELIKAIEELSKGEYTPSASIIYPNLTFLEEQGLISASQEEGGKKQYAITPEGSQSLVEQGELLGSVTEKLHSLAILSNNRSIPEMQRAINNIRMALNLRLAKGPIGQETLYKITDALDRATKEIERS